MRALLLSAPGLFRTLRVVVPFAPRYGAQLVPGLVAGPLSWFDVSALAAKLFAELANLTTVDAVVARMVSAPEDADRTGLVLSTRRIEAVVGAERRALRHAGRNGRVVLLGLSIGGAMPAHFTLVSSAPLAATVVM